VPPASHPAAGPGRDYGSGKEQDTTHAASVDLRGRAKTVYWHIVPPTGSAMSRHPPGRRADYRYFHPITTRWMDNDALQHVNNVVYLSYFDTALTYFEMSKGVADLVNGAVRVVMAEVSCRYHRSVAFPDRLTVGLRAAHIGRSSFRYDLAVFREDEEEASAEGHCIRVFVESATQRPVPVPDLSRAILETVLVDRPGGTA
jgi:acyl-CoA thioester hydrolase